MIQKGAVLFFFAILHRNSATQFLYRFPPKLPISPTSTSSRLMHNTYENKALVFAARYGTQTVYKQTGPLRRASTEPEVNDL
jgi:hypothetical protein